MRALVCTAFFLRKGESRLRAFEPGFAGEFSVENVVDRGLEITGSQVEESALAPLAVIGNAQEKLELAHRLIGEVIDQLRDVVSRDIAAGHGMPPSAPQPVDLTVVEPYNDEKITLLFGRWTKLYKDFFKEGKV